MKKAEGCISKINRFGRYGRVYTAPEGSIEMKNDGGWCWTEILFRPFNTNQLAVPGLKVLQPPAHGQLIIGDVEEKVRLAYQPKPGFTGSDTFTVEATSTNNTYEIPVQVTVAPR